MKYFQIKIDNKIFNKLSPNENYNKTAKSGIGSAFYRAHSSSEFLIEYQKEENWMDYRTVCGYLQSITEIIAWNNTYVKKIEIDVKEKK